MHIWIPQLKALTCAENANHSLHNIQTLRGARTRDARNFARYLDETLERWGDEAEVHYGPHTWPVWGNDQHRRRSSSRSATPTSTSTTRRCDWRTRATPRSRPPRSSSCPRSWAASGTTAATTARCTTTSAPCTPRSWACGTATRCRCTRTRRSNRRSDSSTCSAPTRSSPRASEPSMRPTTVGPPRFCTSWCSPTRTTPRPSNLQADAYEQMGYQIEGPQWRGIFLTAARELREGVVPAAFATASPDSILAMPIDILFDFASVHVIGEQGGRGRHPDRLRIHRPRRDLDGVGQARRAQRPPGRRRRTPS